MVNHSVPKNPLKIAIKTTSHQSRFASLAVRTCLKTKGVKMINPIRCSKKIMVIGGNVYKFLRITPSKAQSSAAIIIKTGPM